jgi:hypothetical protein
MGVNLVSNIKGGTYIEEKFGPKRDEATGDLRKLHNEEFDNFMLLAKHN